MEFDKNIPILRKGKYHFHEMKIGDSLRLRTPRKTFNGSLMHVTRKTGWQFVTRTVKGGTRIWRVA